MPFETKTTKELKEKISVLEHKVAELSEIVKTQELLKLRKENAYYKEMEKLINSISINLKSAVYLSAEDKILVKYHVKDLLVEVDGDGKVIKNDMFYAINKLKLLSYDDMKKLTAVVDNVKKLKKDENLH